MSLHPRRCLASSGFKERFGNFLAKSNQLGLIEHLDAVAQHAAQLPRAALPQPTLAAALNVLTPAYIEWLRTPEANEFCVSTLGVGCSLPLPQAITSWSAGDHPEDYLDAW